MNLDSIARELLASLCASHPMGYTPRLEWRGYRVSAGMAYYQAGVIGLSRTVIRDEAQMRDTLVHEYAHLLAYVRNGKSAIGHGCHWQRAMRDLGAEPKVRHSYPVLRNSTRQQVGYLCQKCGAILVRSKRLPRKRRYIHTDCGGSIRYAWTRQVTTAASMS